MYIPLFIININHCSLYKPLFIIYTTVHYNYLTLFIMYTTVYYIYFCLLYIIYYLYHSFELYDCYKIKQVTVPGFKVIQNCIYVQQSTEIKTSVKL